MDDGFFSISQEFQALFDLIDEQGEGASLDDAAAVAMWHAELGDKLATKVERTIPVIMQQEAIADAMTKEAERLLENAAVHSRRALRMREMIRLAMAAAGETKIETAKGKVWLQKNGGKQPFSLLVPIEDLPDDVCQVQRFVDGEKLRAALEAAGGSTEFAVLAERGTHLRIK